MSEPERETVAAEAADWFARMRGPEAESAKAGLDAWRAADPAHDEVWQRLLQRWDQSAFLASSALARDRDLSRAATWRRRPAARYAAAAASIVVAAASLLSLHWPAAPGPAGARAYASAIGQLREIDLSDGSHVTLDADSAVKIVDTTGQRRVRVIKGRARFTVADKARAPFLVDADGGAIAAQPGEFDVNVTGHMVKVVLWRGSLDVSRSAGDGPSRHLAAGQQLDFAASGDVSPVGPAVAGERGWTRGMLAFDRTRVADAVAMINRYNRVHIVIASPEIGALKVTGAFHASDAGGFARSVAAMFHLSLTHSQDGSIILAPEKKA